MRKVVATEYLTLDGVMDEPGHWSFDFWSDELAKFKYDELFASDALLLGRLTYEGFSAAWPSMEAETGDFGVRMNTLPKYVASTTLKEPTWNASVIEGDVPTAVANLKRQSGQDILLAGSASLVQTLMPHDLIDEYRFLVYPVVLGNGKRLFKEGLDKTTLRLAESRATSKGVLILTYHPASRA